MRQFSHGIILNKRAKHVASVVFFFSKQLVAQDYAIVENMQAQTLYALVLP